jgi:Protein of unknown function (DUF541)
MRSLYSIIGSTRLVAVCISLALSALSTPAFAQSDGILVTVSRNADLAPDDAYFTLAITTDPNISLDDVLKASQVLELTAKNLTSVTLQQFGPSPGQVRLAYAFDLSVPYSKFKETNDKLATARRSLAAEASPMDLQVYGVAVSPSDASRETARQSLLSPLVEDARRRGDQLARAAGMSVGNILSINEAWASTVGAPFYGPYGPVGPTTLKTALTMTVRFAVK